MATIPTFLSFTVNFLAFSFNHFYSTSQNPGAEKISVKGERIANICEDISYILQNGTQHNLFVQVI